MKTKMKKVNYTVSEITLKQMQELQEKTGNTMSELVRRAIEMLWEEKIERK